MELDLVAQRDGTVRRLGDSPDVFGNSHCMRTKSNESLPAITEGRSTARGSGERHFGRLRVTQGPLNAPVINRLDVAPACAQSLGSNSA